MKELPVIHTLWIGDPLSALEQLTLASFSSNGHTCWLWTYDPNLEVPANIIKKDAREILPESNVFFYKNASKYGHGKGSLAGFSDLFRYQLLYKHGGIWVDMDITCLQPMDMDSDYCLRYHHSLGIVGNILKCPAGSPFMAWCYERSVGKVNADNRNWTLPIEILNQGVQQFGLQKYIRKLSNNDQWPLVARMLRGKRKIPKDWKAIHWMNEEFRHLGIDKNKAIAGSTYAELLDQYKIPHTLYTKEEARALRWRLSKLNYTLINLRARWTWIRRMFGSPGNEG